MSKETIVFVIDDDPAVRASLAWELEAVSLKCSAYRSADAFLADLKPDQAGCLILDLLLPGKGGVELLRDLHGRGDFSMPVIVVTGTGDVRAAVESMKLGVAEFFFKPLATTILIGKVQELMRIDAVRRLEEAQRDAIRRRLQRLSAREEEIIRLICAGHSNKRIGATLKISTKTTANHRASIIAKLEAINTADLVRQVVVATAS